jgi:hypothetical protein
MNRLFNPTLAALGLCVALAAAGCDSESSTTTTTTAADTATASDTSDASTGTTDTATGDTSGTGSDVAKTDTATTDTATTDTAVTPTKCDPACKDGEYCDLLAKPPICKASTCKFPDKFGKDVQKVSKLNIPAGTVGCDLDADGKPNNALSTSLATFLVQANEQLTKSIADGTITLMVETDGFKTDGTEFPGNMLIGDIDATNDKCDIMSDAANCKYTVAPSSYDPTAASGTCPALIAFPNMKIKDGALAAGGPKQTFSLALPIQGFTLNLKVNQATLQGKIAGTTSWETTKQGLICGVIAVEDIKNAVQNIESLKDFAPLVTGLLKADIDVDGDGKKESVSVAIDFETVKGQITGLTK